MAKSNIKGTVTGNAGQGAKGPLGDGKGATGGVGAKPVDLVRQAFGGGDVDPERQRDFTDSSAQGKPPPGPRPRDLADPAAQPQTKLTETSLNPDSIPVGGRLPYVASEAARPTDRPGTPYRPFKNLR